MSSTSSVLLAPDIGASNHHADASGMQLLRGGAIPFARLPHTELGRARCAAVQAAPAIATETYPAVLKGRARATISRTAPKWQLLPMPGI